MTNLETSTQAGPLNVSLVIGNQPVTMAVKRGEVKSDRVNFNVVEVDPIHTSFKPMARELCYDVCEMAIVTYLMAIDRGIELTLLPAVMLGRQQHPLFIHNAERGKLTPNQLAGKRVGVRAYSQTTGAWVRGILGDDYGVSFKDINWVTFEGAHVPDFDEPEWVERAPEGSGLIDMLVEGKIDAAIAEKTNDPRLVPVIPDAEAAASKWGETKGFQPINHLVCIRTELVRQHPWLAEEVYRVLKASKAAAPSVAGPDPMPFGVETNRKAFDLIGRYAFEQGLVSKLYATDDLFKGALRDLN
jgi:4,5-dihydroxyphthalate decarboxylase